MEKKPCPFCGSSNLRLENDYIVCKDCHAFGPTPTYDMFLQRELIEPIIWDAWNKRTK